MTGRYHHGDLPNALRQAAVEVIDEKGLAAFSLREVARRAGVSHAAPAHHFGDVSGLLTSLATEAFTHLHADLSAAAASVADPVERLTAIGRAYVSIGVDHPAHCQVMFRHDLIDDTDPDYATVSGQAHQVLVDTIADVAEAINPDLDQQAAVKLCWASMQGLIVLHETMDAIDAKAGRAPGVLDHTVIQFTHLLVEGLRRR